MGLLTLPGSPVTVEFGFKQAEAFVLEPFYDNTAINQIHTIDADILGKQQIAYAGLLGLSGKADTGCGFTADGTITTSEKFWDPKPIKAGFSQCWNDLYPSFLQYANAGGVDRKNLDMNAAFISFISDQLSDDLQQNFLRRAWFSDTSAVSGDFTNGATDLPYFNIYDGLWKQIFDSVTATDSYRYTISENAAASTTAQLTLASDRAYLAMDAMYKNVDSRVLQNGQSPIFVLTRSLFDNYITYLESKNTFNSFERIENGFTTTSFRGIPVIRADFWDRNIQSYYKTGSPLVYDNPNRAILSTKENLRVGVDRSKSLSQIKTWYNEEDELWRAKYATMEDTKMIHGFMVAAAY